MVAGAFFDLSERKEERETERGREGGRDRIYFFKIPYGRTVCVCMCVCEGGLFL